jgi:DNA-binding IclR family transcriptional regulator
MKWNDVPIQNDTHKVGTSMPSTAIDRTLEIVELLTVHPAGLPLSAISAAIAIPKSAAHRLLHALAANAYARQDPDTGRYLLTTKLAALGLRHLAAAGVVDVVAPTLDRLAHDTGELVRLGVIDGELQRWVAKSQGARSGLRYDADMGIEVPLAATASGQAWLACLSDEEALALVARQGFPDREPRGPNAPRTIRALQERLRAARRRGYAWVVEGSAPGTAAMAAAVHHPVTQGVVGTVSVAGPSVRLTEARMHELAPALLAAAAEISDGCAHSDFFTAVSRSAPPRGPHPPAGQR